MVLIEILPSPKLGLFFFFNFCFIIFYRGKVKTMDSPIILGFKNIEQSFSTIFDYNPAASRSKTNVLNFYHLNFKIAYYLKIIGTHDQNHI